MTALYGGSFDPPHMGHQAACLYLLQALGAQAVFLIPAAQHAFGKTLRPFRDRMAMAQAMAAPFGDRVRVLGIEAELAGPSTTYKTWQALRRLHPERRFAAVVGSDLVPELGRWHESEALFAQVPLVVLGRAGGPDAAALARFDFPPRPWLAEPGVLLPEVASHQLRARVRAGEGLLGQVPWAVWQYIEAHRLYREA